MAFITLSGTLLDPNGDLAVGDQIRFTHKSTTGETIESAVSIITVNPAGTYSLPLQYGLVLVEYKDVRTQQFKNLGVATVNGTNPATSIPELLNALVPVSSAELIEFQAILADCVTAQTAAENAATTAEAFAYQLTTTDLIASTATFAAATNIPTSGFSASGDGGSASWKQNGITGQTPSQSPAQLGDALLNDGNGNQWGLVHNGTIFLDKLGASSSNADDLAVVIAGVEAAYNNGGGDVIATGIYNLSDRVSLKDGVSITSLPHIVGGFKVTAANPSTIGKLFGATPAIKGWSLKGLTLDGNAANNLNLKPLVQSFQSTDWEISDCIIKDSASVALNISTDNTNVRILNNDFENIGFTTGVGGVSARQAIAFSSSGHENVEVTGNGFKSIGLDCISIGGITGGNISNNHHDDNQCYALIFHDPGAPSTDLNINTNRAKTALNVVGSVRPSGAGIDLPSISNSTVTNNICNKCAGPGIGIFGGCFSVAVSNNVCTDSNQSGDGIHDAGIVVRLTSGVISLSGNISKNITGSTQLHGLLMDANQRPFILIDGSNDFSGSSSLEVAAATFASSTDVGAIQYQFDVPKHLTGVGTPQAAVSAPKGSTYVDTTGAAGLVNYKKETDKTTNIGWVLS